MVIKAEKHIDGTGLKIKINGRFDFSVHKSFRESYSDLDPTRTKFTIDLSEATYMDSAALGMLLVLRERAGGSKADITLIGYNKSIGQILAISRFEQLFKMGEIKVA
jgi:anti-anti-sigma factor